jgi:hypothetical protein
LNEYILGLINELTQEYGLDHKIFKAYKIMEFAEDLSEMIKVKYMIG